MLCLVSMLCWMLTGALPSDGMPESRRKAFFDELFDYGIATATPEPGSKASTDPWPGVWAPPMVKAGWAGTHMSSYETDFFSDLEADNPEARGEHGKGEQLLKAIDAAAGRRNLTVQLCGGTVPDFLKSLTLPTITNARATGDYDGEVPYSGINGFRNFVAADNGERSMGEYQSCMGVPSAASLVSSVPATSTVRGRHSLVGLPGR